MCLRLPEFLLSKDEDHRVNNMPCKTTRDKTIIVLLLVQQSVNGQQLECQAEIY